MWLPFLSPWGRGMAHDPWIGPRRPAAVAVAVVFCGKWGECLAHQSAGGLAEALAIGGPLGRNSTIVRHKRERSAGHPATPAEPSLRLCAIAPFFGVRTKADPRPRAPSNTPHAVMAPE